MAAPARERLSAGAGLAPAFAAVRVRLFLVAALFALAGVGWWWTVHEMRGMDEGPWTSLGTLGWFLGVWIVMMAAMMFPSVAPTVALYGRMTRQCSPLLPLVFTGGLCAHVGRRRPGRLRARGGREPHFWRRARVGPGGSVGCGCHARRRG